MDSSDPKPSPRKVLQLQGPRPTPLSVSRDSHKIKKPPLCPAAGPSHSRPPHPVVQQPTPPEQAPRAPVIIYSVSPKVIHADPNDFKTVVQRLTGPSPTSLSAANLPPPTSVSPPGVAAGSLSPAARLAAIEGTRSSPGAGRPEAAVAVDVVDQLGIGGAMEMDTSVGLPGILSPMPSTLQPISPSFFSPPAADPGGALAFLNDLSPVFRDSSFLPSPGSFLPSPGSFLSSPGGYWDLFGQL